MKKPDADLPPGLMDGIVSPDWFRPVGKGKRLLPPERRTLAPKPAPAPAEGGERPRLGLRYGGLPPAEGR